MPNDGFQRAAAGDKAQVANAHAAAGSTTPTTTHYLIDVNNPTGHAQTIEEVGTVSFAQVTYIWGLQLIGETYADGATIPGVGVAQLQTTYYVLQDAHGSTRLVTDITGNIVAQYNFDAFGNALGFNPATALTTYLYSSMPYDPAAGNYYDHARFYNTGTGEFTQADTYTGQLNNPMSYLPYAYGGGDGVNAANPSEHDFSPSNTLAAVAIADFQNPWTNRADVQASE